MKSEGIDISKFRKFVIEDGIAQFLLKITDETDYFINFEVYEVTGWYEDKDTKEWTIPSGFELYLTATIKWDGCAHFWFGEKDDNGVRDGYIHLCGKDCFDKHIKLIQELYEFGSKRVKLFDKSVAE